VVDRELARRTVIEGDPALHIMEDVGVEHGAPETCHPQ
jgi:hypothetical protein